MNRYKFELLPLDSLLGRKVVVTDQSSLNKQILSECRDLLPDAKITCDNQMGWATKLIAEGLWSSGCARQTFTVHKDLSSQLMSISDLEMEERGFLGGHLSEIDRILIENHFEEQENLLTLSFQLFGEMTALIKTTRHGPTIFPCELYIYDAYLSNARVFSRTRDFAILSMVGAKYSTSKRGHSNFVVPQDNVLKSKLWEISRQTTTPAKTCHPTRYQ